MEKVPDRDIFNQLVTRSTSRAWKFTGQLRCHSQRNLWGQVSIGKKTRNTCSFFFKTTTDLKGLPFGGRG